MSKYTWSLGLACLLLFIAVRAEAAGVNAASASPLVRIYEGTSIAAGVNAYSKAQSEVKQFGHTEMYYIWQPRAAMNVSQIQFHSSAPGKGYIRIYKEENGAPELLAESAFVSGQAGWQGGAFVQPVQVAAGQRYIVSYAHEKDITDYMAAGAERETVSLYGKESSFQDFAIHIAAPVLQAAAGGAGVQLHWTSVPGASYEIYRNGVQIAATEETSFTDIADAAAYTYTVRARLSEQWVSDMSNSVSITMSPAAVPEQDEADTESSLKQENPEKEEKAPPESSSGVPASTEQTVSVRARVEEAGRDQETTQ